MFTRARIFRLARVCSRVQRVRVYVLLFVPICARPGERASEQASERSLARAFLLIGKYRNARNIEHLDGTASMPLRIEEVPGGEEKNRKGGACGWWMGVGVATIFSTTGLCRPSVLVKRIRRLSRNWERESGGALARFFGNLRYLLGIPRG